MRYRQWCMLVAVAVPLSVRAQSSATLFDGRSMDAWVASILDDTSSLRTFLSASAIRRAPPVFRREFVRRLAPSLESGSPDRKERALDAVMVVVNEGQSGSLMEDRGLDLSPAVAALTRIAQDSTHPERRAAGFLLVRTDSATRRGLAPFARTMLQRDSDFLMRSNAVSLLGRVRDPADVALVLRATRDKHPDVRETALTVLSRWQPRQAISEFIAALADTVPAVRDAAILALGRTGPTASRAIPDIVRFLDDTTHTGTRSFAETLRADAAWALANILPRRGRTDLPLVLEIEDAGSAIRSDGLGPYAHGVDSVDVVMGGLLNLMLGGPRGNSRAPVLKMMRPLRRSLLIDLSHPVPGGGATSLGVIRDVEADVHMGYAHVHRRNMISIATLDPADSLVASERVELQFRINGEPHLLQMGEWVQGEFARFNATPIHGDGTSSAKIAHPDLGSWTIFAPAGSKARLWNLNDPNKPVDRGLYFLPFRFRWYLFDQP